MSDFIITERTKPFTLDEVFSFIDDTNISEMDACELKSRIADAVQGIRAKAVDEFREKAFEMFVDFNTKHFGYPTIGDCETILYDVSKQMKGGAE